MIRLVIVASSISFFMIISVLEIAQQIITFGYGRYHEYLAVKGEGKAEVKKLTPTQVIYNSQLVVSNIQMLLILSTVCIFGIIFGVIQASMDPENHKGYFAKVFILRREIQESEPIGCALGFVFGFVLELIR